ncbi:hypothetical protein A3D23_07260 [candidate division WOR-1 bacterium RIFCSPHIGHO2_02_FULL_53_26]|nr:MAG: hypothetical protein A3D23_07260 [candidate division WOR-1 bacterium RIFCSPHIGHO2_02_FULL_53_26]
MIAGQILKVLTVREGLSEKQVAHQIYSELKKYGAKPAFRAIVASGKRAAIPHGYATNKKIRAGELVVVDFGAVYKGWRSDVTRTYIVGKPSRKQKKVYQVVTAAQKSAIKGVRAGRECREIDALARNYIKAKGFGNYFIHNTGHGIGRRVHQAPKIGRKNRHKLKAGMIITVEPGIYIKGWGGVRIEAMVLVTNNGCKILL